ncbi:PA2169 family four-helix-bundle protein [Parasphingorhabdus cellanae]|uniref:PA2169 family four-helix-bundle protein n=1 Tax=Parasphingorhabdus cellanae TaxID=2806553 RepID=A0ABX7T9M2_9SPHN|nr:PA2169 family four-helix-bundle protein [Parasphingorhabdus cellanae]QTD57060.1 PA2169 family four-helix-bundle protein [Parasphingorhabdus cellanae]
MFNDKASTLNGLIATTIDSAKGYEEAAQDTTDKRYEMMFKERAQERNNAVLELRSEVRRLGEEPEDDGTVLAGAHRMFMGLKEAVVGQDDKAIVQEVERGEDHIKAKYEEALQDDDLDPASRTVVQNVWTSVKQGHDQMSALKNQLES